MVRRCFASLGLVVMCALAGCGWGGNPNAPLNPLSFSTGYNLPLGPDGLGGDTAPIRDPTIFHIPAGYVVASTDTAAQPWPGHLPLFCAPDRIQFTNCGAVFSQIPAWIHQKLPTVTRLWAPDISYFNGLYHLYYSASVPGTQNSLIALATNTTLDPSDPAYAWQDQGEVLGSSPGANFNAIDPNILVDTDGQIWLTYGSYWTGIKQHLIDPVSGKLSPANHTTYSLASRPNVPNHPIEGASLVHRGSYYYLFVSVDICCDVTPSLNDYKVAVGRSTSPNGPFTDTMGTPMLQGGGTVILTGDGKEWVGVGGESVYYDDSQQQWIMAYHAQRVSENLTSYLWVKNVNWKADWPTVQQPVTRTVPGYQDPNAGRQPTATPSLAKPVVVGTPDKN